MNFFDSINNLNPYRKNLSAVIIKGDNIGDKAIWSDNELVYYDGNKDFWVTRSDVVCNSSDCNIINFQDHDLYVEIIHNTTELIICGGGHISIPIIKMGKMLGFSVTVIEDRPKFADNARNAEADIVYCDGFKSALNNIKGGNDSYFVIVTRGHRHDQLCLESVISKENAYIGMIGSRSRVMTVKENMINSGFPKEKIDEIFSPIGLDIQAETPEEIAVAIIAEIIQVKNKIKKGSGYGKEILKTLINKENQDRPRALVTIIERKGSAPRGTGAKMVVFRDGTTIGSIGGGCVEAKIMNRTFLCIDENKNEVVEFDMTEEEAEDDGMICGGKVKLLIEII